MRRLDVQRGYLEHEEWFNQNISHMGKLQERFKRGSKFLLVLVCDTFKETYKAKH